MAFRHAEKTGQGQGIDIARVKSMSKVLNDIFVHYFQFRMVSKGRQKGSMCHSKNCG